MSRLARETGAVNLGQGFPDDPGPEDVRRRAAEAVVEGWNQYPPMMGLPELRGAVAAHYRHWQGLDLDPDAEVMVTSGATEALAGALFALIEPGDEVVLFEPMYDAYLPLVRRAGGVPRFVTLRPPDFRLTEEALGARLLAADQGRPVQQSAEPERDRVRRGGSRASRRASAPRFDAVAVCDEVWEHVVFDGRRHRAADGAGGHARADGQDRLGGQDLQPDGLEGRLRLRRAAADAGARQGAPVPHLHDAAEPPGRRRLRPRQGRRLSSRACAPTSQASRDRFTAGLRSLGFDALPARAPTSSTSTSRPWARATTSPSAAASSPTTASPRSRSAPSTPTARCATWCASASPSATRRSTRRSERLAGVVRQAA